MFHVIRIKHIYGVFIALPVLIALIFSFLFVAYEFSSVDTGFDRAQTAISADPAGGSGQDAEDAEIAATGDGTGSQSLTADSVLRISWLSISFIGQAFCGGLFSRTNPRASFDAAGSLSGTGIISSRRLTSAILSGSINELLSRQIFTIRISRLKAG